jgi:hypothetical protein
MRKEKKKMDPQELAYRAFGFEKVCRIPYAVDFTVPAYQKLCATARGRDLYRRLANDVVVTPAIRVEWGVRDSSGLDTDEFGLTWDRRIDLDIGVPRPFVNPDNLDTIRWPDPSIAERFDLLALNMRTFPDRFHMVSVDFSLFERALGLRGFEQAYWDMVDRPDFLGRLLDRVPAFNMEVL